MIGNKYKTNEYYYYSTYKNYILLNILLIIILQNSEYDGTNKEYKITFLSIECGCN